MSLPENSRPQLARQMGVNVGDLIDARGKLLYFEDDYTAVVEFKDGPRGANRCSVPLIALTYINEADEVD